MLSPYTNSVNTNIRVFARCYKSEFGTSPMDKTLRKEIYKRYVSYDVSYNISIPLEPIINTNFIPNHLIKLCYKQSTNFKDIYFYTLALNNQICAFCLIRTANEVDHFLPKNEYPEYSIFAKNLLPICSNCNKNRKKKFSTLYNGNIRKNFNLYFDDFVKRMFTYNINYINGLPFISVEISYSTTLNNIQLTIIKEHYNHIMSLLSPFSLKLEYAKRIELFFKDIVSSHIAEMHTKSTFEEFKNHIELKVKMKLKHTFDFLWFNESFLSGDVNMDGFYIFLKNIYDNLDNLNDLNLEPWLLDSLNIRT